MRTRNYFNKLKNKKIYFKIREILNPFGEGKMYKLPEQAEDPARVFDCAKNFGGQ